jgi:hypothetical protein
LQTISADEPLLAASSVEKSQGKLLTHLIKGAVIFKHDASNTGMERLTLNQLALVLILAAVMVFSAYSQQPARTEKQVLIMKFRQLTGADRVNLGVNVSFEDVRNDLVRTVDGDKELTESQKQDLRKFAIEAYDRLDKQLKAFLNDTTTITPLSEAAVFQVYDQAFNETELNELITFYRTPTGQKALQFLPTLSAQVQKAFQSALLPQVQAFITPKIKAEGEQLKQKVQDAKTKKP